MAEQNSGQEKTEQPTPRRRQEARKKGQVARSNELVQAVGLITAALLLPGATRGISESLLGSFQRAEYANADKATFATLMAEGGRFAVPMISAAIPLLIGLMVAGVVANIAQVGVHASTESIKPEWKKVNPLEGAKRLFSRKAAFEGFKAVAKMTLFGIICWISIQSAWPEIVSMARLSPMQTSALFGDLMGSLMLKLGAVWIVLAALDYGFQRAQHEKQLRMTKQELKQEMKEQEGSPEVKQALMRKRRSLSQGAMGKRIAQADVVVTNPTHFSVAIRYDRSEMHAPMVVAKGQDYLALKIRELAAENEVPIVPNKPLARALYRQCEAGDFVPRELFEPVAEVLAYVYRTLKRVRQTA